MAGLFLTSVTGDRVFVFIDYQNVYHRARASFPETTNHSVQGGNVHPLEVGKLLCNLGRGKEPGRSLAHILIYRAIPDFRSGSNLAMATRAQIERWNASPGVKVCTRPMDYIERTKRGKPHWIGREKGIDVMLAVDLVDLARTNSYDTGIVFSADTDLLPALEAVVRMGKRIETATWQGRGDNREPLRLTDCQKGTWNHYLDESHFDLVRDDTDYLKAPE